MYTKPCLVNLISKDANLVFYLSVFKLVHRLISVVDVVGPMNPYQPIPFHILSFAVFQSRILIYAGSNIYNEIAEEKKILERNMDIQ